MKKYIIIFVLLVLLISCTKKKLPEMERYFIKNGLVDINSLNKDIKVELRYGLTANFLHANVYGDIKKAYLREIAAKKLAKAEILLKKVYKNYSLIVFDAARPRSVQLKMWDIVKNTPQRKYVGNPTSGNKRFSLHNYGIAVDLSIIDKSGKLLDMGTIHDYFGKLAEPQFEEQMLKDGKLTKKQLNNRKILRKVMVEAGFHILKTEWWHFDALTRQEVIKSYSIIK